MLRVAADVTETGRLFHTRVAATEKARSPMAERRVGGTTRALADHSRRRVSRVETGEVMVVPDHEALSRTTDINTN